ncbi:unnamed protein product [Linum trigynum]|uniref:Transmembrane protein n=1 Tax=Linum trigynum TaxID=586398 RepID=A0AAV2F0Q0_9ROSI
MVNPFELFRKYQYEHYFTWFVLAGAAGLVMGYFSAENHVAIWICVVICFHYVACWVTVDFYGRWWRLTGLTPHLLTWIGQATLQCLGIAFAVALGIIVTKEGLGPMFVLGYTVYAFSISRFLMFRTRFDFTSAWICTAASVAWSLVAAGSDETKCVCKEEEKSLDDHEDKSLNIVFALLISGVLIALIFAAKFLDEYRPADDAAYDKGRRGHYGFQDRPDDAPPPPGLILQPAVNLPVEKPPTEGAIDDEEDAQTDLERQSVDQQPQPQPQPRGSGNLTRRSSSREIASSSSSAQDIRDREDEPFSSPTGSTKSAGKGKAL